MKLMILNNIETINEKMLSDIPYPQANNPKLIIDILNAICLGKITIDELTSTFNIHSRQILYYCNACRYLGLVKKIKQTYIATIDGYNLSESKSINKYKLLAEKMLSIPSINTCCKTIS